ncbi:hypothetical protein AM593_03830, partial [Mytilus galloprovincialis]
MSNYLSANSSNSKLKMIQTKVQTLVVLLLVVFIGMLEGSQYKNRVLGWQNIRENRRSDLNNLKFENQVDSSKRVASESRAS